MSRTFEPPISRSGSGLPSRVVMHGTAGVGKTSLAAHSPRPIFGMTPGETGLLTLIDNGQIGETDHFDEYQSWTDLLGTVEWLTESSLTNKTFVLDTLNGAERMCVKHTVSTKYGGSMEKYQAYGKGPDVAAVEWVRFLGMLDVLRQKKKMSILCLCHTKVKPFKNPGGDDFDRYMADMDVKTWDPTFQWSDVTLFATFDDFVNKDKGALKAKGYGGTTRSLYTERTAAYDAKNRLGLPHSIPLGSSPAEGWSNLASAMKQARLLGQQSRQQASNGAASVQTISTTNEETK